jgi:hypothetical protein
MKSRFFCVALLSISALSACASLTERSLSTAWGEWRHGSKGAAIELASAEMKRYLEANGLEEKEVASTTAQAFETLEETPLIDGLTKAAPNALTMLNSGPSTLTKELQQDLKSDESARVMRGLQSVKNLSLRGSALQVLAIIYRRTPYEDALKFFPTVSPALRSVSVKWAALKTLIGLAVNE